MLTHETMQSSFRAMSLAFALAGTLVLCGGCSQGEGDRCEIDSDCSSGLVCRFPTDSPHNGICSPISTGSAGSTGQDAAGGSTGSAADAASDGPVAAVDAGSDSPVAAAEDTADDAPAEAADAATSVDVPVVDDGASVGGDISPDAEAVDSLSAID